ncbi:MAG: hypothetical protein M3381_15325 [Actinomycetota bacterium]|nr:hypothetical protein [Actinomycetota bacterium]
MITKTNAISIADGITWAASNRLRYLGAPDFAGAGEKSVLSMVAQVRGGIPPRREPH